MCAKSCSRCHKVSLTHTHTHTHTHTSFCYITCKNNLHVHLINNPNIGPLEWNTRLFLCFNHNPLTWNRNEMSRWIFMTRVVTSCWTLQENIYKTSRHSRPENTLPPVYLIRSRSSRFVCRNFLCSWDFADFDKSKMHLWISSPRDADRGQNVVWSLKLRSNRS